MSLYFTDVSQGYNAEAEAFMSDDNDDDNNEDNDDVKLAVDVEFKNDDNTESEDHQEDHQDEDEDALQGKIFFLLVPLISILLLSLYVTDISPGNINAKVELIMIDPNDEEEIGSGFDQDQELEDILVAASEDVIEDQDQDQELEDILMAACEEVEVDEDQKLEDILVAATKEVEEAEDENCIIQALNETF